MSLAAHVRETTRFKPGRPALKLGLRTALATVVPLTLGPLVSTTATTWMSTAGFMIAIADKGGSYRTRARTMGGATLVGALVVVVAGLAEFAGKEQSWVPALAMLVCASVCSIIGVLGPIAAATGNTALVLFCISLGLSCPTPELAFERGIGTLAGGVWAMMLALFFWPVRLYRPARFTVARCYRAVAAHARLVHRPALELGTTDWLTTVSSAHGPIRVDLEAARAVLAATRRGRRAESGRGALLLVLLQTIDLLFAAVVALEDVLDIASRDPHSREMHIAVGAALHRVEECLEELADRVEHEGRLGPPGVDWTLIGSEVPAADDGTSAEALHRRHVAAIMMRLRDGIALAYDTTDRLYESRVAPSEQAPVAAGTEAPEPPLWERFAEGLRTNPLTVRHAARMSLMSALAVLITQGFGLQRGYWVTLTVVILLQPYTVATATKTWQRVAGTAVGGTVAALIIAWMPEPNVLLVLSTLLCGITASVLQLNYGLYSFFLTPTFVLLAEVHAYDVHLPALRFINTVIGGVLAIIGSRLFWPQRESDLLPSAIADVIDALRGYFDQAMQVVLSPVPAQQLRLVEARRNCGLKLNVAEASLQRGLNEVGHSERSLEPVMTILLYARRMGATFGALAAARALESSVPTARIERVLQRVDLVLSDLESAVRDERRPAPLPDFDPISEMSEAFAMRLARVPQQLAIIHEAVARWNRVAPRSSPAPLTTPRHPVP